MARDDNPTPIDPEVFELRGLTAGGAGVQSAPSRGAKCRLAQARLQMSANHSKVVRGRDFRWEGVDVREYKTDSAHFKDITRQTLLGEADGESALTSVTRYFEIEPGGHSTLERHEHPHSVVILRGRGRVVLDDRVEAVAAFDCVYVAPQTFHQFQADGDEPLGFLCVVDRDRDRPQLPTEAELERMRGDAQLGKTIKF